jgi:ubiquinone/menaquinone biosynthesis C-methylase UbiE
MCKTKPGPSSESWQHGQSAVCEAVKQRERNRSTLTPASHVTDQPTLERDHSGFVRADAQRRPLCHSTVDAVFAIAVLQLIPDPEAALAVTSRACARCP